MCACAASTALGGSALIKAPVEQQCTRHGLEACPDLVNGIVLYVEGDEPGAEQMLRRAASKNTPGDVKRFARAISTILPSETGQQIAAMLTGEPDMQGGSASRKAAARDEPSESLAAANEPLLAGKVTGRLERVQLSMAAQTDPLRLTTETVIPLRDADKALCKLGDSNAVCVRLESGPLVVTDAMTPPGCTTDLIIGAADANGRFGWIAPTTAPGFHGARFFVRSNQWVLVAARSTSLDDEGDDRCYVTWAAFKPRVWPPDM